MLIFQLSQYCGITKLRYSSGWWFGTFFTFPYIGNNHSNWLSYFSEGWPNHQPVSIAFRSPSKTTTWIIPCDPQWENLAFQMDRSDTNFRWSFPILGTPKWLVYNGKPYLNGWFRGTSILGNLHMLKYQVMVLPHPAFLADQFQLGWTTTWLLENSPIKTSSQIRTKSLFRNINHFNPHWKQIWYWSKQNLPFKPNKSPLKVKINPIRTHLNPISNQLDSTFLIIFPSWKNPALHRRAVAARYYCCIFRAMGRLAAWDKQGSRVGVRPGRCLGLALEVGHLK